MQLHLTSILVSLAGLTAVVIWRLRETRSAVTQRKIVIPPLGMATGFSMFILPAFRFPPLWGVGAFLIGYVLLAYPMLLTTRLIREGDPCAAWHVLDCVVDLGHSGFSQENSSCV